MGRSCALVILVAHYMWVLGRTHGPYLMWSQNHERKTHIGVAVAVASRHFLTRICR